MSIELDAKLIRYVEKFPFLYYRGAMNYNNELQLANTWKRIGRDLKVSAEYCMNRWKYLRRRFTREPRFALPEKEWVLMKYLRFLEPFIHRRKPLESLSEAPAELKWGEHVYQSTIESQAVEWEDERPLPLWNLSNDSFCQSLSKTLQTLTTDQQVSCRIDILVVIEKYLSSNNADGSSSTNSMPSGFHSRPDTLASDMSKRFAEILSKINCASISSCDEDWLIIFAAKNFICKLLEIRKKNAELDKLLPTLVSVDNAPQIIQEHERQVISAPQTTAECRKPVSANRGSEMSKIDGNDKPQSSSIFNSQAAHSAEMKPESVECIQFHSSATAQHTPESNKDLLNPCPTGKPIRQTSVPHSPVLPQMRKENAEPALASVNNAPQSIQEHGRQVISAPQTTAEFRKPVCANRGSAMSKIDGNNEPQPSSIFSSPAASSVEIKPESAECTLFYSSMTAQRPLESNQDLLNPCPTEKPLLQTSVLHGPVQSWLSFNPTSASSAHVETCPIKTESCETELGSSEPVSQNSQSASNTKNSNSVTLKPKSTKQSKSAPTVTSNRVILRPTTNLKSVSSSKISSRMSNSAVNSGSSASASNSLVPNIAGRRSTAKRSKEFENAVHETLKNINSADSTLGFMQDGGRFLCVLCDIWFPTELYRGAHTRSQNHVNYTRDYFLHCSRVKKTALPKLDKSLYVVHNSGLLCVKCKAMMKCRSSFVSHMTCGRHKSQVENFDIEAKMIGSIDQVIVSIGSSNYCVLCNVKLFDMPPAEHISTARHQRENALLKGIFKIDRHAYCSYCNEKFSQTALTQHVNDKKHASKILFFDSK